MVSSISFSDSILLNEEFLDEFEPIILHRPLKVAPSSTTTIDVVKLPFKIQPCSNVALFSTVKSPSMLPLIIAFLDSILPFTEEPFAVLTVPLAIMFPLTIP